MASGYSSGMPTRPNCFASPCIPTRAPEPPAGPGWVHEIKVKKPGSSTTVRHREEHW
jgi:hypothetical protein